MFFSSPSFHILKILIPICLILSTSYYLFTSQGKFLVPSTEQISHLYTVVVSGRKSIFVEQVLQTEIEGPFNNSAIVSLCNSKKWIPGLIFKCEAPQGGIGNVRNALLNCIRYAIEAGATSLIVPEITARGNDLSSLAATKIVPFNHFFDLQFFISSLCEACPQIHIIANSNDLWDIPSTSPPIKLSAQELDPSSRDKVPGVLTKPGNWSVAFNELINLPQNHFFTGVKPRLVLVRALLFQWPLSYDPPEFVAQFGRILRFREDVRRLAATVLYAMDTNHDINVDPMAGIQPGKFYGAHLRTAIDAMAAGWTNYANQSANYLSSAVAHNLPLIYLACGNEGDIERFTDSAGNKSIAVTTKNELLFGLGFKDELAEMQALTWDQQGLVDYEVLLRSSVFGGTWESSFGWNIAMRRHVGGGLSMEDRAGLESTTFRSTSIYSSSTFSKSTRSSSRPTESATIKVAGGVTENPMKIGTIEPIHSTLVIIKSPTEIASLSTTSTNITSLLPSTLSTSTSFTATSSISMNSKKKLADFKKVERRKEEKQSFEDGLSVLFGKVGLGRNFELSMWP